MSPFLENIPGAGITAAPWGSLHYLVRERGNNPKTASQGSAKVICASPFFVDMLKNEQTLLIPTYSFPKCAVP